MLHITSNMEGEGREQEGMGRKGRRGGGRGGEIDRQGFGVGSEACRKKAQRKKSGTC